MSNIVVAGAGVVSPAGWGMDPFLSAIQAGVTVATKDLARPGWKQPLRVRQVPPPTSKPAFLAHPRLRRTSPISQYAVAASLEALGTDAARVMDGSMRLGVIVCVMSGCVNYSRRFYDEVLREPATASPLVFPETVFNAPGSHLAALLGSAEINYTLVGDPGTYLQGLALAAQWLTEGMVDGCVVAGSEEMDWLTADAFRMFSRRLILSDGAGALYLRHGRANDDTVVELTGITDSHLFLDRQGRAAAVQKTATQLRGGAEDGLLCDGLQGDPSLDRDEARAWNDWPGTRLSPKKLLGEGLMAAAAWQCALAVDWLRKSDSREALVNVAGSNQQVIGAHFSQGTVVKA